MVASHHSKLKRRRRNATSTGVHAHLQQPDATNLSSVETENSTNKGIQNSIELTISTPYQQEKSHTLSSISSFSNKNPTNSLFHSNTNEVLLHKKKTATNDRCKSGIEELNLISVPSSSCNISTIASLSKIAGLDFTLKHISPRNTIMDIESYIGLQYYKTTRSNQRRHNNRNVKKGGNSKTISHPIFGIICLASKSSDETIDLSTTLAFPTSDGLTGKGCEGRLGTMNRNSSRSLYHGGGVNLSLKSLRFPEKISATGVRGLQIPVKQSCPSLLSRGKRKVRIVSEYGATIRQEYLIDETHRALGKLKRGAVRQLVATMWIQPSTSTDDHNEDDCKEEDLIAVKRYQIRLLPEDYGKGHTSIEKTMLGWISDRSRLKDDPYLIAEVID